MFDEQDGGDRESRGAGRVAGAISLIAGVTLAYTCLYWPLQQAPAGFRRMSWMEKWGFISPMLIIIGISLVAFPQLGAFIESKKLRNENGTMNVFGILVALAVLAPLVAVCILVNQYVENQLRHFGHVVGRN